MRRKIWLCTISMLSILILSFISSTFSLDLTMTLQTDKSNYVIGETVNISGLLLIDGAPVNESLVAIQVNNPSAPILFRTIYIYDIQNPPVLEGDLNGDGYVDIFDAVKVALAFGSQYGDPNYDLVADVNKDGLVDIFDMVVVAIHYGEGHPPHTWRLEIVNVYIADSSGRPINQLQKGSLCYIWTKYKNTQDYAIDAAITITVYDSGNNPIYVDWTTDTVSPKGSGTWVIPWTVPSDAELGSAKVYANIYNKLPQNKGTPHSPEKSVSFDIVSTLSGQAANTASTTQETWNFATSFRLKNGFNTGTYTVHAGVFYFTGTIILGAYNSTNFQVS